MEPKKLWSFSVSIYEKEGVASACLNLQNQCQIDIAMMLAVIFACRHGKFISDESIVELQRLATPWQCKIVKPLRQIRTLLKTGPLPAPNKQTNELRDNIKALELIAEKIQMETMQKWIDKLKTTTQKGSVVPLQLMTTNIIRIVKLTHHGILTKDQRDQIQHIASASIQ